MSPAALGSRPGGTEAPLAYVFRALDLLEVHRRGRRKAAGICKSDGGRLAPALPSSLSPRGQRPRGGGAVRNLEVRLANQEFRTILK